MNFQISEVVSSSAKTVSQIQKGGNSVRKSTPTLTAQYAQVPPFAKNLTKAFQKNVNR